MLQALIDVGYAQPFDSGGEMPVTWETVHSYSEATGVLTSRWEKLLLRDMSRAYLEARLKVKTL